MTHTPDRILTLMPTGAPCRQMTRRQATLLSTFLAASLLNAACSSSSEDIDDISGKTPDGSVEIRQTQVAFIGSGAGGSGILHYRGRSYPFSVGGAGIGGIGASSIEAEGQVYNLQDLSQFPGIYAQARAGFAAGTTSAGSLWLRNGSGVVMHLQARRTGLILSLGADAMRVDWAR